MTAGDRHRIGRYRLLERLGAGGMGVVWRAVAPDGQPVALKTLRVDRPALRRALLREIAGLARLRHPGIATLVDHGEHDGHPWYAMPWIAGRPLLLGRAHRTTWVDDGELGARDLETVELDPTTDLRATLTVFHRICGTLAWLHGEGIVHRDLKPENFLVRPDGWPILLDFGLAGRFAGGRTREAAGDAIVRGGTVGLMAPEQRAGELVDARADLYALGCMLFAALTGALPPEAGRVAPRPSALAADVPPALDALVARLLARRPEDRPGHAGDVARVLAEHGADPTPWPAAPPARPHLYRPRPAGRAGELDAIDQVVRAVAADGSAVLLLAGDAGIGRSRLVLEAAARAFAARLRPVLVTPGAIPTLGPAVADLAPEIDVEDLDGVVDPALGEVFPRLRDALGPSEGTPSTERTVHALLAWLARVAARRPLVLAIDDLDAADELTLALVARIHAVHPPRLAVVAAVRDPAQVPIELLPATRTLRPLGGPEVGAMVADMLATPSVDPRAAERFAALTGGRPLLVVEAVRTGVELGLLTRAGGRWRLEQPLDVLLPQDGADLVTDLYLRRVARIPQAHRDVLAVAALAGEAVDLELLRALLPDGPVEAALAEGVRDGTLDDGETVLRFVHAHMRAALAGTLPPDARAALHGRIADRLAARPDPSLAERRALAEHLAAAGRLDAAREAWARCARAAYARGLPLAAAQAWRAWLALPGADPVAAVATRGALLLALVDACRFAEVVDLGRAALAATPPGSPEATATARALVFALLQLGREDEAVAAAHEAVAAARAAGHPEELARTLAALGFACWRSDRFAEARAVFTEALALEPSGPRRAMVLLNLAGLESSEGRRTAAERCIEQALALDPTPRDRVVLLANLVGVRVWGGALAEAARVGERAIEAARAVGDLDSSLRVEIGLVSVDWLQGRLEAALLRARLVADRARAALLTEIQAWALIRVARIHVDRGDPDAARAALAELPPGTRKWTLTAHVVAAQLARRAGDLAEARRALLAAGPPDGFYGDDRAFAASEGLHLAWAEGRDGAEEEAALARVLARLVDPVHPDSHVGRMVARLDRARRARAAGEPLRWGEHPDDLPAG